MNTRSELNKNLAEMLKGGVIMDVVNAEEAIIAEKAGAVAVMCLLTLENKVELLECQILR